MIGRWGNSPFDLRRRGLAVAPTAAEMVIRSQLAAVLGELRLLDRDCERIALAIRVDGELLFLCTFAEGLEMLIGSLAVGANHETNLRQRQRQRPRC